MQTGLIIGCGYLGLRVAEQWLAQGDRVWATTRSTERAAELRKKGLQPILCDVLSPPSEGWPTVNTVLYAVGLDRRASATMRAVYVDGLTRVLERLPSPGRWLHVSSTSVYGQTGGEEVDELAATEPLEENGRIVLEAETVLRTFIPEAVVLRFAGIYGPDRLLRRKESLLTGQPIEGDPDQWLNLIHVDDGVRAVQAAANRARLGTVYNVADDHPVRRKDFYALLARLLGAPEPPWASQAGSRGANRRIMNRRLRKELQVELRYPGCAEGLPASLG